MDLIFLVLCAALLAVSEVWSYSSVGLQAACPPSGEPWVGAHPLVRLGLIL